MCKVVPGKYLLFLAASPLVPEVTLLSPELLWHFICPTLSAVITFHPLLQLNSSYLLLYLPSCFSHFLTKGVCLRDVVITGVGQQIFQLSAFWAGDRTALSSASGYMSPFGTEVMHVIFRWMHLIAGAQLLHFIPVNCDRVLRWCLTPPLTRKGRVA